MNTLRLLESIRTTGTPLKKQLLMVALITHLLAAKGKPAPVIIGGCALAYYSREVYFTADIDLAYADCDVLDEVLQELGFRKDGRYWVQESLQLAIEVPTSNLAGETAVCETVELEKGLTCLVVGIEDLIIDRLNAAKYWKSATDREMTVLLIRKYASELDWAYLRQKAALPENDTSLEIEDLKKGC